jgi:uncharacterized protein YkwD
MPIQLLVQFTGAVQPTTKRRSAALVGLTLAVVLLSACLTADESTAVNLVNQDRAANGGVKALVVNDAALTKAQGWAKHLATASGGVCSSATLSHSNLAEGAPAGWKRLGENVACRTVTGSVANAVAPLQAQLMASSGHRANILDSRFTHVGIGIAAVSTGTNRWVVFETQFFAQL